MGKFSGDNFKKIGPPHKNQSRSFNLVKCRILDVPYTT